MKNWEMADISGLIGKVLVSASGEVGGGELLLKTTEGATYRFLHHQDCCESVYIESIVGDLSDLVGEPLLLAEEVSSDGAPPLEDGESFTWTFYKFATRKGYVDVRWYGSSNGYYSERVDIEKNVAPQPERREYCLTPKEFNEFVGACNPRIVVGDARLLREHAQRCAQAFWEKMGRQYGFDWTTTEPVQGKHQGFFTAVPLAPAATSEVQ